MRLQSIAPASTAKGRPTAPIPRAALLPPLLGAWFAFAACGGCAALAARGLAISPGPLGKRDSTHRIRPAELDELTRAFADRYVGLLSSTCDALKKDNRDVVQRREAQQLMLNSATHVYDIASNADAFTRMLDLVVVTHLVSGVWVDDGRAREVFPDRSEVLVRALQHGRAEARALAAQVLRPQQLAVLDKLMLDWKRDNPDMVRMASVRFSNFAIGRGTSSAAQVLAARGWFAHVGTAGRSVDEARLLTERMFYMLKRQPTLLRWELEAIKDDLLATPEVEAYLADVHRLTDQAQRLPSDVAAEREAIVAAVDARMKAANETVANVRSALAQADGLAASVGEAGVSLDAMLRSADGVLRRYDEMSTDPAAPTARPFDVREYTAGVKELSSALGNMNDMLKTSDRLLGSSEWGRRIDEVNQSADARIRVAAEQSQVVITAGFRQLWATVGGMVALFLLYRLIGTYSARRGRAAAAGAPDRTTPGPAGTPPTAGGTAAQRDEHPGKEDAWPLPRNGSPAGDARHARAQ